MGARLRRVRPHLGLVVAVGPVIGGVLTAVGGWLPGLVVPAVLLGLGAWYFRSRRFRPRRWPVAGAVLGAAGGSYLGAISPWLSPAAVLFGLGGWVVARRARESVLEPYTPELADSPVEVPWQARGAKGLELLVAHDRITLSGGRGPFRLVRPMVALSGVGTVEQVMVARRATLPVPGVGELRVTVTPGPAVRITVPPGEWIVPTDHGREIARLVARRKELAGI
ncbi:hypothetical protein [Actinokineospora terrae]|uniref:Uncharacterized protein n=1 Tax=Actinokineospora terrae TaxID=155974 RepID=A0A1H9TNE6_9PSEU|nr:hypothetical protein [Actinokineospora terrae]SER98686.1 hypothetical protein SAMN04487818_106383 [Actinokineospora terrae]